MFFKKISLLFTPIITMFSITSCSAPLKESHIPEIVFDFEYDIVNERNRAIIEKRMISISDNDFIIIRVKNYNIKMETFTKKIQKKFVWVFLKNMYSINIKGIL